MESQSPSLTSNSTTLHRPNTEWPAVPPAPAPITPLALRTPLVPDDSPTVTIPVPVTAPPATPATPAAARGGLYRALGRATSRSAEELVWQSRFALTSALVILGALVLVTLPLWVVLYRISAASTNNGAGPKVSELVALSMVLMGAFLTGGAAWMVLVEMRTRVRILEALSPSEGVLRSSGQLPAQIAMLVVVVTLFASATALALH